jgi:hypothetical protein
MNGTHLILFGMALFVLFYRHKVPVSSAKMSRSEMELVVIFGSLGAMFILMKIFGNV